MLAEINVRAIEEREIDHLARLWYQGWQDAHAQIIPAELRRLRTLDSFRQRLQAALSDTRLVGPVGARRKGFASRRGTSFIRFMSRRRRAVRVRRLH
jgi:hypothetical protein